MFGLQFRDILPQWATTELDQLVSKIKGYLLIEHNEDGGHTDITADSVIVAGDVDVADDVTIEGNITVIDPDEPTGSPTFFAGETQQDGILDVNSVPSVRFKELGLQRVASDNIYLRLMGFAPVVVPASSRFLRIFLPSSTLVEMAQQQPDSLQMRIYRYFERSRAAAMGEKTDVAYADANFTGNVTGNADWVVGGADQVTYSFSEVGKQMTLAVSVISSDVANAPTELEVALPGGVSAAVLVEGRAYLVDAGAAGISCRFFVRAGATKAVFMRDDGAAFTNTGGAGNTQLSGAFTFWTT